MVGGIITAVVLIILSIAALGMLLAFPIGSEADPTANIVIIQIPSPTWTVIAQSGTSTIEIVTENGIAVGQYVQVMGTEGEGLRIRSSPSLNSDTLFVALDAEAFEVTNGPVTADGRTWWYLTAPYDTNRSGWAASDYLRSLSTPQP